jgi:hypothetical protein
MNHINHHVPVPSSHAMPSLLLLTEKSSVTVESRSMDMNMETIEIRANMVTPILKEIPGYSHYGINE